MRTRLAWCLLALTATGLTACTSDDDPGSALAKESPAVNCPTDGVSDLPLECVPDDGGFDVSPAPASTVGAPADSAAIPAVVLPRQEGDLVLGGNDTDPAKSTEVFEVTVAAGARLSASVACRGFADLEISSEPASKIGSTLPCGEDEAIELTVLDPVLLTAPVTYRVTVSAPSPSRWFVALGSVTRPAPTS